jgi:hypothetical protein
MKTFNKQAAQGDLMIRRIKELPENLELLKPEDEKFVVAHSETGHNHVIDAKPNVKWYGNGDPMVSYLQVEESLDAVETLLEHMRSYDTHESIAIQPGLYEIRRQREYSPEGWKRVED